MAKHCSFDTKLAILETIRANGAKDAAGYWVYADGWNDARIAKETDTAPQVVSSIRQAHCGEMKKGGFKQGHKDNIFTRLTLAEAKIDQLIAEIDALKRTPVGTLAKTVQALKEEWADHRHALMEINGRLGPIEGAIKRAVKQPAAEDQTRLVDIAKLPHVAPRFGKTNGT
jgi:hypothetical protein